MHIFKPVIILCALAIAACFPSETTRLAKAQSVEVQSTEAAQGAASPASASNGPGCRADACDKGELPPPEQQLNALGGELEPCSTDPMTGWFRDGHCRTDANDRGVHVVCGVMTEDFLTYTKNRGNDLSTRRGSFPGLEPGDRWCLCASRWEQARKDGHATPVVMKATNQKAAGVVENASDKL